MYKNNDNLEATLRDTTKPTFPQTLNNNTDECNINYGIYNIRDEKYNWVKE